MGDITSDERLRRIEALTDSTLAHLSVEEMLSELLDRVRELLHTDSASVLLLDPSSQSLVATAARGVEEVGGAGRQVPLATGFAGRIASERTPMIVDDVDEVDARLDPIVWRQDIRSLLGVPMVAQGEVIGVLRVGTRTRRRFGNADVELLQLAADRIALAAQAQISDIDRAAALALQRSLLPPGLPATPGLELAARYVTGAGGVGGDWYDMFTHPSGWLSFVIGDVVGRGLQAAVVMGRIRSALRAYALESDDPADVLARLDRKMQHFEPDFMATVLYGMVEPGRERLLLSSAGHPSPVLAAPGQPTKLLDLPPGLPLGVQLGVDRQTTVVDLPPGGLLLSYTDGLIERRGDPLHNGLERLRDVTSAGPPEAVCTSVMNKLAGSGPAGDDIAVLAVRRSEKIVLTTSSAESKREQAEPRSGSAHSCA